MSLHTTPPPARTDAPSAQPVAPKDAHALVRAAGVALAAGAASWAAGIFLSELDPVTDDYSVTYKVTTLLFQLGLVALVGVQLRTRATGTGKLARGFLHAEHVLLGLAIASSIQWLVVPDVSEQTWALALDLFWPLSMLGMAGLGIRVAIAGRWRGAARAWPAVAETWALVNLPVAALASESVSNAFAGGHLLIGYTLLGLILVVRPDLTAARDRVHP
jgi:hypothetical protein